MAQDAKGRELPRGITFRRGQYRVRVYYEGRQHDLPPCRTLTDAKATHAKAKADIARGTFVSPAQAKRDKRAQDALERELQEAQAARDAMTLRVWSNDWLGTLDAAGRSPGTRVTYQSLLNHHILPAFGDMPISAITSDHVEGLLKRVIAKAPGSANSAISCLRACLNVAVERGAGGLTDNPASRVNLVIPKSKERDDEKIPTREQVAEMIDAAAPEIRLGAQLAAYLGLRIGEVLGLQRHDFHELEGDHPTVGIVRQFHSKTKQYTPPKSKRPRTLPIPDFLVDSVTAHLDAMPNKSDTAPVIYSTIDNTRPMSHNSFNARWKAARDSTGNSPYVFHLLRHYALTAFGRTGATTVGIMRFAGHTNLETAQRYQHADANYLQEMTSRIEQV